MTNEEKSYKIAYQYGVTCCDCGDNSTYECYDAALEMAKWKDKQFKEYLEKKKEEIERTEDAGSFVTEMILNAQSELLDEIINELFGETKTNTDREE